MHTQNTNTKRIRDFALRAILPTMRNTKKVSRYSSVQNFPLPPTHPKYYRHAILI